MLSYILPFIILILVVVFIHEYGHDYFAKRYGVAVTDFSIGFGKEIFGWNDKSGTRWKIWSTHPNNVRLTNMLAEGTNLVNNQKLNEAIVKFSDVIELDPNWAEAWNKRATVFYLIGEYQKSQNDIDKVLGLEKRHFGALAGQGLVNIELQNYEKAIKSYQDAMKIYPTMNSGKIMIKRIKELIKKQSI